MADVNFGILDTQAPGRIAAIPQQAQAQQTQNMLAALQAQQTVRQGEVSQMQLKKIKQEEADLEKIRSVIVAHGGPPDLNAAADAMIGTGNPMHIETGQKIKLSLRNIANADAYRREYGGAPANALNPTPLQGVAPMTPVAPQGVAPTPMALPPRAVNTLAPPMTTAVNSLVTNPSASVEEKIKSLERQYHRIGNNPELQSEKALVLEQIKDAQRQLRDVSTLPPEVKLMQLLGLPSTQAGFSQLEALKQNPSEFERLLTNLKLPAAEERALRLQFATKLATHAPGTNIKVNTFLPASEEAQRDFIKSTRATYDTLKQAPAIFANIEEAKKLIPAASVFMGTGGEGMKTAASFLNNRLGMSINTEGVKNAEELRSRLFQGVMANLKKLDSQPSERQQAALEKALGSLDTDPNALANVMDAYADSLRNNIDTHNAEVQSAIARGVKFPYDPIIKAPAKTNGTAYVETKKLSDGRVLGKKADGTVEVIK